MVVAMKKWIAARGEVFVMWPDVVALLSDVVCHETPNYKNTPVKTKKMFEFNGNGQLYYYYHGFERAMQDLLERPPEIVDNGKSTYTKKWPVKNFVPPTNQPGVSARKEEKEELLAFIMCAIYSEESAGDTSPVKQIDEEQEPKKAKVNKRKDPTPRAVHDIFAKANNTASGATPTQPLRKPSVSTVTPSPAATAMSEIEEKENKEPVKKHARTGGLTLSWDDIAHNYRASSSNWRHS